MPKIPSPPVLVGAVLGGYAVGRRTGDRRLAGIALTAGLAYAVPRWSSRSPLLAAGLTACTVVLVGLSHPLSRRWGPRAPAKSVAGL